MLACHNERDDIIYYSLTRRGDVWPLDGACALWVFFLLRYKNRQTFKQQTCYRLVL